MRRRPRDFGHILFWEVLQNLPLAAGFLLGLELWQEGLVWPAVLCLAGASALGSLVIWATEGRIVAGHREPVRLVLVNISVIALLMLVLITYLSASWSSWWTDLVTGAVGGLALGVAQALAAGTRPGLGHCAALAAAFVLGLVAIRLLSAVLPLWLHIVVIATVVSAVIVGLDYGADAVSGAQEGSGA